MHTTSDVSNSPANKSSIHAKESLAILQLRKAPEVTFPRVWHLLALSLQASEPDQATNYLKKAESERKRLQRHGYDPGDTDPCRFDNLVDGSFR